MNTIIDQTTCSMRANEKTGRISAVRKNIYTVRFEGRDYPAKLSRRFYDDENADFPVVGDYVIFRPGESGESLINSRLERNNLLCRPDQSKTGVMQYMVANVDYVFIVTSLNEDYSYNRIARYVSIVITCKATPVVILTKCDLCSNPGRFAREVESIAEGVRVHTISALYGIGLDELNEYLKAGTTICFMGSSGAGKSTLLNAITGEETMKTGEVRESDSTGKHTTTHRQLIELENGVSIIDTPGMREVGMASNEEGLDNTFSDIKRLESMCRFSDCRHETEPGCAVKAAIERGELTKERLMLYRNLNAENVKNYAKKKAISKWVHEREKFRKNNERF